jgi:hypothetical protein
LEEILIFLFSYAEAHKIKLKADALEAWELEKWHSERQQDLLQKEAKFKYNKQQELLALQKRIQTGREEQKKQRHLDLERYYVESTDFFLSLCFGVDYSSDIKMLRRNWKLNKILSESEWKKWCRAAA